MTRWKNRRSLIGAVLAVGALPFAGCNTVGSAAADLGLAGAGGVAGYHLSDGNVGGAAAGAAVGYLGSRIAQKEIRRSTNEAEKRGYDRAMNQAVKQQYWIMQAQQRERSEPSDAGLVPVVIPETKVNGVVYNARVEYLRVAR